MRVRALVKRNAGFPATPLPGYKAAAYIEGTLVGNCVVVPPGEGMHNVEQMGFKRAPWLVLPFAGGKLEWVATSEDPTAAILGQQQGAPAASKPQVAKAKEA